MSLTAPPVQRGMSSGSFGGAGQDPTRPAFTPQPLLVARPDEGKQQRPAAGLAARKIDAAAQAQTLHQRAVALLHKNGDLEGALSALNAAIELMPRAHALLQDRGLLYRKLGRWTEAIQDYGNARALEERVAAEERLNAARHGSSPSRMARASSAQLRLGASLEGER